MASREWRLPSLDEVAQLDPEALGKLYRDVAGLQADLFLRLTACKHDVGTAAAVEDVAASDSWFTVKGAAEHWRKSTCWVRRAINRGEVRGAKKLGGEWRIPAAEVLPPR